ncbi:MAG: 16S rRNA (guanine(527)-N(7))-methyltransferase RsmG [Clostridiales bacterium GWF2_38_85]|nr:MAG: 16S rRNA (guanine(527)-N(7))-methyltransferase RsmG [Clostridiales bacterium GWF2_38_85]
MDIAAALWHAFAKEAELTETQLRTFQTYYFLLVKWNKKHNLTAITDLEEVINYHFLDSLMLGKHHDMSTVKMLADIGTGAGFPALPLKIKYPHLALVLVEVTEKKCEFLRLVTKTFGMKEVEIVSLDWRTFVRKTNYPLDLICARASLQPEDLMHMFKTSSPYREATLVYWAADGWEPDEKEKKFLLKEDRYRVGEKRRKYVFFKQQNKPD